MDSNLRKLILAVAMKNMRRKHDRGCIGSIKGAENAIRIGIRIEVVVVSR